MLFVWWMAYYYSSAIAHTGLARVLSKYEPETEINYAMCPEVTLHLCVFLSVILPDSVSACLPTRNELWPWLQSTTNLEMFCHSGRFITRQSAFRKRLSSVELCTVCTWSTLFCGMKWFMSSSLSTFAACQTSQWQQHDEICTTEWRVYYLQAHLVFGIPQIICASVSIVPSGAEWSSMVVFQSFLFF